ncbi:MAG: pyridoxamine 5'-phosphate oxidase family protein [Gammaproteobacteria bacterium]|nr:pyridoxamine 5'-phosphate oxidase family protein [Gammaproteobacteria bacterium]MCP5197739.1 pyridoxamine 5'-phosphate oxidase family protein [Gammaproteobacteria bacterium]
MAKLIHNRCWAALATQGPDGPEASWVAYAPELDFSGFLFHLSTLAGHTRNLLAHPHAGLAISELEREGEDPQTLARIMIKGEAAVIARDSAAYPEAARCYQERLPDSTPRFAFGDFLLFRFNPITARFIGGFARAYSLDAIALQAAAQRATRQA